MNMIKLQNLFLAIFCTILSFSVAAQSKFDQWLPEINAFQKADEVQMPKEGVVLFTGSSSIRMWKDMADYFPQYAVLNRGFGGSTFEDLIHFQDALIFAYKPSRIFIYEGDNDISEGKKPEAILKEAMALRDNIREEFGQDLPVVFISPKPSIARWELKEEYERFNTLLEGYTNNTANTYFADVWYPVLDENGEVRKDIFIEDGLHMNAKGYAIWKEVLLPFFEK
jgi:lysophospholipase L1-like esterase